MHEYIKNLNILVVDDFAQFRQTIKAMLMRLGTPSIDQASNGSKALKLCMENNYDIILCDYNLGDGQDGQQLLEELHERNILLKGVLFLMVTAETTSIQVMAAIEYRPDSYLTKPFTTEELGQRLKRLLIKNKKLKPLNDAFNQKDYRSALSLCDSTIKAEPSTRFTCLRVKSEILELLKQYDKALELYQDVSGQQLLLWAILGVGKMLFAQNNIELALEHFQQMSREFPHQVNVLDWIAKCQKALGDNESAEQSLLSAIQISPKSVRRQAVLGEIALSLNHHDIAHQAFEKTIAQGHHSCLLTPKHYQHYFNTAQVISEKAGNLTKSRMLTTAEALAKRMESKYESNPTALASNLGSLAQLFSSAGRDNQSQIYLSKLSTTLDKPNCMINEEQYQSISDNLKQLNDNDGQSRLLDKLSLRMDDLKDEIAEQKIKDISAIALNKEGLNLARNKHLTESLQKFREAITLSPNNSSYLLNASQIILLNDNFRSKPEMVDEAKSLLSTLSLENSGKRWSLYKKLMAYLPNDD